MQHKLRRTAAGALGAVLMVAMVVVSVPAQRRAAQRVDPDKVKEASEEARQAAEDIRKLMNIPAEAIPRELFERAEAVAVFPNIVKAAFIIGGRGGDGVISRRTTTGWSAPAFFNLGGGSFGPQIGIKSTDLVLLFMNEGALKGLLEDKFEIGGDVSVAAGPVGRTAGAATNLTLDAGILSYSRSKGLFAGASLKGAVINPDNNLNEAIYGMKAREILTGERKMTVSQMPAYVRIFPQTLARYSSMRRSARTATDGVMMVNASYNVGGQQSEMRNAGMTTSRPVARIAREVRNELNMLPYYSVFDWLEFEVQPGGVVILRGQVTTPPDTKPRAEAYVKDVEGVTRVVNNIEVLPVSPNDQRLREALYRAVYSGPQFRYHVGSLQSIHIIVDRGRATLKGVVNSEGDKTLAYTQARTVPGLFEVKNELIVRNGDERRAR